MATPSMALPPGAELVPPPGGLNLPPGAELVSTGNSVNAAQSSPMERGFSAAGSSLADNAKGLLELTTGYGEAQKMQDAIHARDPIGVIKAAAAIAGGPVVRMSQGLTDTIWGAAKAAVNGDFGAAYDKTASLILPHFEHATELAKSGDTAGALGALAGDVTTAALLRGSEEVGIPKSVKIAGRAAVDLATDRSAVSAAVKAIPGANELIRNARSAHDVTMRVTEAVQRARQAEARSQPLPPSTRPAPPWANAPEAPPPVPDNVIPISSALPSGRVPGGIEQQAPPDLPPVTPQQAAIDNIYNRWGPPTTSPAQPAGAAPVAGPLPSEVAPQGAPDPWIGKRVEWTLNGNKRAGIVTEKAPEELGFGGKYQVQLEGASGKGSVRSVDPSLFQSAVGAPGAQIPPAVVKAIQESLIDPKQGYYGKTAGKPNSGPEIARKAAALESVKGTEPKSIGGLMQSPSPELMKLLKDPKKLKAALEMYQELQK